MRPLAGGRRPLRDLVIYELMIDDCTAGERGAARAARCGARPARPSRRPGRVRHPVHARTAWTDERFSWGYTPALYYSVSYRYANDLNQPTEKLSWLKRLISECHDRGLHVLMDGVFNHAATAFPLQGVLPASTRTARLPALFAGEFPGLQDLDFNNRCTQELILDVCRYWIEVFGIDGIRFDNTVNFYTHGDNRGLPQLGGRPGRGQEAAGEAHFSLTLEHLAWTRSRWSRRPRPPATGTTDCSATASTVCGTTASSPACSTRSTPTGLAAGNGQGADPGTWATMTTPTSPGRPGRGRMRARPAGIAPSPGPWPC